MAKKGELQIKYTIGEKVAKKNTASIELSAPGRIVEGSTLVPLRFVGEALGAAVGWESASRIITISSAVKQETKIKRFIDGYTFIIDSKGQEQAVRLLGIDTIVPVPPGNLRLEPHPGYAATDYFHQLLADKTVFIELDTKEKDEGGNLLCYIYLSDGTLVNARLVAEGYAKATSSPPNTRWDELLLRLQTDARDGSNGLWAIPEKELQKAAAPFSPAPVPTTTPAPATTPANGTSTGTTTPAQQTPAGTTTNTVPSNSSACKELKQTYSSALQNTSRALASSPHQMASVLLAMAEEHEKELKKLGCQ